METIEPWLTVRTAENTITVHTDFPDRPAGVQRLGYHLKIGAMVVGRLIRADGRVWRWILTDQFGVPFPPNNEPARLRDWNSVREIISDAARQNFFAGDEAATHRAQRYFLEQKRERETAKLASLMAQNARDVWRVIEVVAATADVSEPEGFGDSVIAEAQRLHEMIDAAIRELNDLAL